MALSTWKATSIITDAIQNQNDKSMIPASEP